ncbi:MAG: hypothetical protein AB1451_08185 [Nitrospirota bacterium]
MLLKRSLRFTAVAFSALLGLLLSTPPQVAADDKDQDDREDRSITFDLVVPDNPVPFLPAALPDAGGEVRVVPLEEEKGIDEIHIKVFGVFPNEEYVVFFTWLPEGPFGPVQYIADLKTNEKGRGEVKVKVLAFEAFAFSSPMTAEEPGKDRRLSRADLDHLVIWPADPAADDQIFLQFTGGTGPITPFDGDGEAGPAILTTSRDCAVGTLPCTFETLPPGPLAEP